MIARSMTFSSSRTLPGHAYCVKRSITACGTQSIVLPTVLALLVGQIRDKERNVLPTLTERRHVDGKDVKPVVEIGAKPAGRDRLLEVPVGGGDEPDIDPLAPSRADSLELPGLQHTKQLDLDLFGKLSHLVEKERAAVRELETAGAPGGRAGEGAPLVPEQFRFHEGRRQRRAIDDDQGLVTTATLPVHGAGDELLSRAGLTHHQHRRVGCRHLRDLIEQPQHRGRLSDDVLELGPDASVAGAIRFASKSRFQYRVLFERTFEGLFDVQPARQRAGERQSLSLVAPGRRLASCHDPLAMITRPGLEI